LLWRDLDNDHFDSTQVLPLPRLMQAVVGETTGNAPRLSHNGRPLPRELKQGHSTLAETIENATTVAVQPCYYMFVCA